MKRPIIQFVKSLLPPGAWRALKKTANRILIFTGNDISFYYDADYARGALKNTEWVEKFCREIIRAFNPSSVVDFGCSIGVILADFEKRGIDILGIDGSAMSRKYSLVGKKNFLLFDLRRKLNMKRKYDLCLCLETAEHIEERYSDILIGNISQSSSNVIFSAAPPEQTGDCHFNLKSREWWVEKFKKFNFEPDSQSTEAFKNRIKNIPGVPSYYISNIMIFREMSHGQSAKEYK